MEFEVLDAGDFYKLEKVGPYVYLRPSPAAVWPKSNHPLYSKVDAKYERYQNGKGKWIFQNSKIKSSYEIQVLDLTVEVQQTSFGHLGLFAEQLINWKRMSEWVKPGDKVLNLFAYTGLASLICAAQGAEVVHIDASKSSVAWARKNQELSKLDSAKIRWMVDDVQKFVAKEIRRKNEYDWIILDPPSFGRGNNKEVWQIEEHLNPLMLNLAELKSKSFKGILLSSHSPGYSPQALENILKSTGFKETKGFCEEMLIENASCPLPSGACAWQLNV
jgi:23S rRNA (cytosine1962-C5)-methyltransferase